MKNLKSVLESISFAEFLENIDANFNWVLVYGFNKF